MNQSWLLTKHTMQNIPILNRYICPNNPAICCRVKKTYFSAATWGGGEEKSHRDLAKSAFSYCKLRRRLWLSKQTIMIVNVEPLKRPAAGVTWIMVFNLSNLSRSSGWLGWGLRWYPAGTWRELLPPQCGANALNYHLAVLLVVFLRRCPFICSLPVVNMCAQTHKTRWKS